MESGTVHCTCVRQVEDSSRGHGSRAKDPAATVRAGFTSRAQILWDPSGEQRDWPLALPHGEGDILTGISAGHQ